MKGRFLVQGSVIPTIGPRGRNATIGKPFGPPRVTNDGVTIAKEIDPIDPFASAGAEGLKDDAERMNKEAGDGSSTFITLTRALDRMGMWYLRLGVNPMAMKTGMERAAAEVVRKLQARAFSIMADEVEQVATISAQNPQMGKLVADTINKIGRQGVVTVEESMTLGLSAEIVEGLRIDRGYISPIMMTEQNTMEAEYAEASILVTDKKITQFMEIKPFIDRLVDDSNPQVPPLRSLVIICDDLSGDALKMLMFHKLRGSFAVLAVRATGYGEDKREFLQDIATTVGATIVSDSTATSLETAGREVLGSATRVTAGEDRTIIVGGGGDKTSINARVALLQGQLKKPEMQAVELSRQKLEERIGKLSGGVAIIRVGATNEGEMTYMKDKIEDTVNATRAAIAEGVLPGGGSELVMIADEMRSSHPWYIRRSAEQIGYDIVIHALYEPFKQIVKNAGYDPQPILRRMKNHLAMAGFDAVTGRFEGNMYKAGIVDPVKVTRIAVQYAVASSAIALTSEVAIVDADNVK